MSEREEGEVISMAKYTNEAGRASAMEVLEEAIKELRERKEVTGREPKVVVLMLDDFRNSYDTLVLQAGLKASELIALYEVVKVMALEDMGG